MAATPPRRPPWLARALPSRARRAWSTTEPYVVFVYDGDQRQGLVRLWAVDRTGADVVVLVRDSWWDLFIELSDSDRIATETRVYGSNADDRSAPISRVFEQSRAASSDDACDARATLERLREALYARIDDVVGRRTQWRDISDRSCVRQVRSFLQGPCDARTATLSLHLQFSDWRARKSVVDELFADTLWSRHARCYNVDVPPGVEFLTTRGLGMCTWMRVAPPYVYAAAGNACPADADDTADEAQCACDDSDAAHDGGAWDVPIDEHAPYRAALVLCVSEEGRVADGVGAPVLTALPECTDTPPLVKVHLDIETYRYDDDVPTVSALRTETERARAAATASSRSAEVLLREFSLDSLKRVPTPERDRVCTVALSICQSDRIVDTATRDAAAEQAQHSAGPTEADPRQPESEPSVDPPTPSFERVLGVVVQVGDVAPPRADLPIDNAYRLIAVPDERALLRTLAGLLHGIRPDVLTGFNVVDYDARFLLGRAERLALRTDWGKLADVPARLYTPGQDPRVPLEPEDGGGDGDGDGEEGSANGDADADGEPSAKRTQRAVPTASSKRVTARFELSGVVVIDMLPHARTSCSLRRYGLNDVLQHALETGLKRAPAAVRARYHKATVDTSCVSRYALSPDPVDRRVLASYCFYDTFATALIDSLLLIVSGLQQLAATLGVPLQDAHTRGKQHQLQISLYRFAVGHAIEHGVLHAMPDKRLLEGLYETYDQREYDGATVLEPQRELWEFMMTMDFTSLYPSIIRDGNLCPSACIEAYRGHLRGMQQASDAARAQGGEAHMRALDDDMAQLHARRMRMDECEGEAARLEVTLAAVHTYECKFRGGEVPVAELCMRRTGDNDTGADAETVTLFLSTTQIEYMLANGLHPLDVDQSAELFDATVASGRTAYVGQRALLVRSRRFLGLLVPEAAGHAYRGPLTFADAVKRGAVAPKDQAWVREQICAEMPRASDTDETLYVGPLGALYVEVPSRRGIVAQMVDYFVTQRSAAKDRMEASRKAGDARLESYYHLLQLTLKLCGNSMYGFLGALTTSRMPSLALCAAITATGRSMIGRVRDFLLANTYSFGVYERELVVGKVAAPAAAVEASSSQPAEQPARTLAVRFVVLYGDTDSVMIVPYVLEEGGSPQRPLLWAQVDAGNACADAARFRLGVEVAHWINTSVFPGSQYLRILFEKILSPFLLLNAKKYVGWKRESPADAGKLHKSGIELQRRDAPPFAASALTDVIMTLFRDGFDRSLRVARAWHARILAMDTPRGMTDYVLTSLMSRELAQYDDPRKLKHVSAGLAYERDNPGAHVLDVGNRIPYVLVRDNVWPEHDPEGKRVTSHVAHPLACVSQGLQLDVESYVQTYYVQTVRRLFMPMLGSAAVCDELLFVPMPAFAFPLARALARHSRVHLDLRKHAAGAASSSGATSSAPAPAPADAATATATTAAACRAHPWFSSAEARTHVVHTVWSLLHASTEDELRIQAHTGEPPQSWLVCSKWGAYTRRWVERVEAGAVIDREYYVRAWALPLVYAELYRPHDAVWMRQVLHALVEVCVKAQSREAALRVMESTVTPEAMAAYVHAPRRTAAPPLGRLGDPWREYQQHRAATAAARAAVQQDGGNVRQQAAALGKGAKGKGKGKVSHGGDLRLFFAPAPGLSAPPG